MFLDLNCFPRYAMWPMGLLFLYLINVKYLLKNCGIDLFCTLGLLLNTTKQNRTDHSIMVSYVLNLNAWGSCSVNLLICKKWNIESNRKYFPTVVCWWAIWLTVLLLFVGMFDVAFTPQRLAAILSCYYVVL